MTNKAADETLESFQEKKKAYLDALHAELGLNRRFQLGFFVTEFLVNVAALEASYPKLRSRSHLRKYFEQSLATLAENVGADHWKVACHNALSRDYLANELKWATAKYRAEPVR